MGYASASRSRILFVEDEPDIRETLGELLRDEGYDVTEAPSAEAGLDALAAAQFDVVLSDYNLPEHSGVWMIAEAKRRGCLGHATPLLLTASARVDDAEGIRVLTKPIDVDVLVREIASLKPEQTADAGAQSDDKQVELVLFVHGSSETGARALQAVERILRGYALPEDTLRVVDVATPEGVEWASREHVAFTPALLRAKPTPARWVVGELRKAAVVERLLKDAGVQKR